MSLIRVFGFAPLLFALAACSKTSQPAASSAQEDAQKALEDHPRWQTLSSIEATLSNQLVQVRVLMGWRDLANRIAQMQGKISASQATADLQAYGQKIYATDYGTSEIAEERRRVESAASDWLDAIDQNVAGSARWPDDGPAQDWQPRAKAKLDMVRKELGGWLDQELDPAPLLEHAAKVEAWTRGEPRPANPFADHDAQVLGAFASPEARALIAPPDSALSTAADSAAPPDDERPIPGEMGGAAYQAMPDEITSERPVPGEMGLGPAPRAAPPGPGARRSSSGCLGFAGTWETSAGRMPVSVQGTRATGSYTQPGGTVEGTVSGPVLEGRWNQADRSGQVRLQLSADGNSFDGQWTEADGSGGGAWTGRCNTAGAVPDYAEPAPSRAMPQSLGAPPMDDFWEAMRQGGSEGVAVHRSGTVSSGRAAKPLGAGFEMNTNRPGADMGGAFDLPAPDPEMCRQACREEQPHCKAFTYVKPDIEGPYAACYVKVRATTPQADACCISGLP